MERTGQNCISLPLLAIRWLLIIMQIFIIAKAYLPKNNNFNIFLVCSRDFFSQLWAWHLTSSQFSTFSCPCFTLESLSYQKIALWTIYSACNFSSLCHSAVSHGSTFSDTWAGVRHLCLALRKVRGWVREELGGYQGCWRGRKQILSTEKWTLILLLFMPTEEQGHLSGFSWWLRTAEDSKQGKCSCRQEGGVWWGYLRKGLGRRINCITATSKLICSL